MKNNGIRIGLTYDLRDAYLAEGYSEIDTAEFDRAATIDSIETTLTMQGYAVDQIGNVKQLAARLTKGDTWDMVFNICEGMHGIAREAQVPALLDAYEIPYVFSDALVCALTLHKGMTKDVVRAAGVATPDYAIVHELADVKNVTLPLPLFAKPTAEGTGKGINANSKINSMAELRSVCRQLLNEHKGQPVLVERFLPGREFTVGIIGTGRKAKALATMEIVLLDNADAEVYSYRNKEECEELVQYSLLSAGQLRQEVEALALRSWRALGCRDAGRIDVRLDDNGQVHFIEVNPLAGIHPEHSDLPIMAIMIGVKYDVLIGRIMASAMLRLKRTIRAESVAA
ncbi:MAG: ATP-grasp domain-containing protein [Proteobacteria bacterium]|nr:ATP-grasp domain-containing protein [Pseudomonadota bacterium]MDA1063396.1 ATP-grasp domain-containing protein [Pseudomonadota bacterium]